MLNLTINVNGKSKEDLLLALEVITKLVSEDYTSGFDRNEEGNYSFEMSGEEEVENS